MVSDAPARRANEDTRQRLLHSAGALFAEKGFRATTVRDICRQAEVNLQAVSYHFGDKQRLYVDAVRFAHDSNHRRADGTPAFPEVPAGAGAEEQLEIVVREMVRQMSDAAANDQPAWCMPLLLREMSHPTDACREIVEAFVRPMHRLLERIVARLLPVGADETTRHLVVLSIVGQCVFFKISRPMRPMVVGRPLADSFTPERIADHVVRFTRAALAGYSSTPPETASSETASSETALSAANAAG